MRILTECICPPIPIRTSDWLAWVDGEEETDYAHGATEAEAIANLRESLEESQAPPVSLTPRETEVVRLVAAGLRNKAIAGLLGITEVTVKNHIARIMRKLSVSSRMDILLWSIGREKAG